MNAWTDNLFYLVFLGQILLISYFVPRRMLSRTRKILETCTPETHPELYPEPLASYRTGMSIFKWTNRVIIVLGLALLVIVYQLYGNGGPGHISDALPAAYGLLQFLPAIVMQRFHARANRRIREIMPVKQRKADLRPRRWFDFVSPALFILALALMITAILVDLYFHDFAINGKTLPRGITVLISNGLLALVGWWHLYGRNRTPHRDPAKRGRNIGAQLTVLLLCSIALSIYLLFQSIANAVGQHDLDAIVMSLYFQVIMAMSIGFSLRTATPARQSCA
jgi:hypothetical protein